MIEVYTAENCPKCKMVKHFLTEHNLPFVEKDALEKKEEFNMLNITQAPVVLYKNTIITGFDIKALQNLEKAILEEDE